MQNNSDRLIDPDRLDERTVKPVAKLVVVVAGLFLLWALVSNLPGIDAMMPWPAVTYGAVLGAVLTLAIVGVLVHVAMRLEPLLARAITGPTGVSEGIASLVKQLVLFLAVITAHRGLAQLLVPTLGEAGLVWTYDLLFLILALIPTVIIAYRLFDNVDPIASMLVRRFAGSPDSDRQSEANS